MTGRPIPVIDEEDDEDEDLLLSRVPEDTSTLQECITASQGCLLLLVLKQHLKTLYGFNDRYNSLQLYFYYLVWTFPSSGWWTFLIEHHNTFQTYNSLYRWFLLFVVLMRFYYCFSKITQYSPSESAKVYEKAVNRKSNAKFNPKATLQKIKQGALSDHLDEDAKRALLSEYLEVSQII